MAAPSWLEPEPPRRADPQLLADGWRDRGTGDHPRPTWEYLQWIADQGFLLHGSQRHDLRVLTPRTPVDSSPDDFSKQTAVFLSGSALWSMLYAVKGPDVGSILNACVALQQPDGWSAWHYFCSYAPRGEGAPGGRALARPGWVHVVEPGAATRMPAYDWPGLGEVLEPQWACPHEVPVVATVPVTPDDVPLRIGSHDTERVVSLSRTDPWGFPWLTGSG